MIVDTSAVIAVLRNESDAIAIGEALQRSPICRLSVVTYVEAGVVTDSNRDPVLSRRLDDLLRDVRMRIEPVTVQQAQIARQAYRDFGQGRNQAGLNFGDCFAYALAKDLDEPLLFKGSDFKHTDIEVAKY
jgi:ribonuclease VapC